MANRNLFNLFTLDEGKRSRTRNGAYLVGWPCGKFEMFVFNMFDGTQMVGLVTVAKNINYKFDQMIDTMKNKYVANIF